jgi:hypothetical protein
MALTHTDLLNLWPESLVTRLDPMSVRSLGLPDDAARVLVEVGLPAYIDHYEFRPVPPRLFTVVDQPGTWCQVGEDEGGDFSVELATGAVWSCVDVLDLLTRFVNSSLAAFVECLCAAVHVRREFPPPDRVTESYEALRQAIRGIDPPALYEHDDDYWSVILEQMEIGLF